jgi:hypothetical protein
MMRRFTLLDDQLDPSMGAEFSEGSDDEDRLTRVRVHPPPANRPETEEERNEKIFAFHRAIIAARPTAVRAPTEASEDEDEQSQDRPTSVWNFVEPDLTKDEINQPFTRPSQVRRHLTSLWDLPESELPREDGSKQPDDLNTQDMADYYNLPEVEPTDDIDEDIYKNFSGPENPDEEGENEHIAIRYNTDLLFTPKRIDLAELDKVVPEFLRFDNTIIPASNFNEEHKDESIYIRNSQSEETKGLDQSIPNNKSLQQMPSISDLFKLQGNSQRDVPIELDLNSVQAKSETSLEDTRVVGKDKKDIQLEGFDDSGVYMFPTQGLDDMLKTFYKYSGVLNRHRRSKYEDQLNALVRQMILLNPSRMLYPREESTPWEADKHDLRDKVILMVQAYGTSPEKFAVFNNQARKSNKDILKRISGIITSLLQLLEAEVTSDRTIYMRNDSYVLKEAVRYGVFQSFVGIMLFLESFVSDGAGDIMALQALVTEGRKILPVKPLFTDIYINYINEALSDIDLSDNSSEDSGHGSVYIHRMQQKFKSIRNDKEEIEKLLSLAGLESLVETIVYVN